MLSSLLLAFGALAHSVGLELAKLVLQMQTLPILTPVQLPVPLLLLLRPLLPDQIAIVSAEAKDKPR